MSGQDVDAVVDRIVNDIFAEPTGTKPFLISDILAALKPVDRLPGGLRVVPEEPTWAMEQASLTAPMPPYDKHASKKKRHENLVAKIHARWAAMLAASGDDTTPETEGNRC